jgi:sodium-coupled neutral amino acid transporter 9
MMGTSLLSMPWAVEQAGLVAGLSLILVMAAICFYTAFCILQVYGIYGILLSVMVSLNDVIQFGFYGR